MSKTLPDHINAGEILLNEVCKLAGIENWRFISPAERKCHAVWTGFHVGFRCKNCGISESSCLCLDCFEFFSSSNNIYK